MNNDTQKLEPITQDQNLENIELEATLQSPELQEKNIPFEPIANIKTEAKEIVEPVLTNTNIVNNNQESPEDIGFNLGLEEEKKPETPKISFLEKYKLKEKFKKIEEFLLKKWWLVLGITTLLVVTIFGSISFFIINSNKVIITDYNNINLRLEGPDTLPKGNPGTWKLTIENKENIALLNGSVELDFDKSFEFSKSITSSPTRPQGDIYSLPRLEPYQNGIYQAVIEFQGISKGNVDEEIEMKGNFFYSPEPLVRLKNTGKLPSNASDRKQIPITLVKTRTTAARININISTPNENVANNTDGEIIAQFENTSEKDIRDIRVQMVYPQGFTYSTSELKQDTFSSTKTTPDDGNNIWNINIFNRLSKQTLRVKGKISGATGAKLPFIINIQLKNGDNWQTIATRSKDLAISGKPLAVNTQIVDKDDQKLLVAGETLDFLIDYHNQGVVPLKNVELVSTIQDPAGILDWSSAKFSGGDNGNLDNRTFRWSGKNIPQFETLGVNVKGQLKFSIKLKDSKNFINTNYKQNDYILIPNISTKAENLETENISGRTYKAKGGLFFVQSIVETKPEISVGNTNQSQKLYKVTWTLTTLQNQINQVEIRAKSSLLNAAFENLYPSIVPDERKNELTFNAANGDLVWKVGNIPSFSGVTNQAASISFVVNVPEGQQLVYNEPEILGLDDFTAEKILLKGDAGKIR